MINIQDLILFEDEFLIVIDKPAGLMVEPDRNQNPSLLDEVRKYLRATTNEPYAQHIHRLDRVVSGIVLFTKNRNVLKNLSEQFAERKVKKHYQALTTIAPAKPQGRLEHWHRKEKKKAVLYANQIEYSEKAVLDYSILAWQEKFLWSIELQTGKYHQIRAQLASTGCPIVGDALYGSQELYKPHAIALHACRLIFHHPINNLVIDISSEFSDLSSSTKRQ
jgi:RluA family pseudouridine synthase